MLFTKKSYICCCLVVIIKISIQMEAIVRERYTLEIRPKSVRITNTLGATDKKALLRQVAEENILAVGFKALLENQFTPVILVVDGVENPTYFDAELRRNAADMYAAARETVQVQEGAYVPKRIKPSTEITLMLVRSLVNRLGFGECAEIEKTFLPAFDDKGRLYRKGDAREFVRKPNGAKIECYEITFGCSILDVEKTFIDLLAEGLYLDSHCPSTGCIVYLSTTLEA